MSINLLLALIGSATLGVIALLLLIIGTAKKRRAKMLLKNKQLTNKTIHTHSATTRTATLEPTIDTESDAFAMQSETQLRMEQAVDPALTDLGFNALDNLLTEPVAVHTHKAMASSQAATPSSLVVLHVMAAAGQPFRGYELLQAVTAAGLRLGKMNIFHYADPNNPTKTLFSLSSAVEPGCFDITNIGALACPGLSLFMRTKVTTEPQTVFNLMLETARQLAADLSGSVCDDKYQPLTQERVQAYSND